MSRVVRKVLVILSDISERSASKDLEREMKPLLDFPCVFQVVSDTFIALSFTQKQFYDVIIAPQKVEDPISISTFIECLVTSDGFSPPFICLLEQEEEEQKFEKAKTVFVRYTDDGGIPIAELSTAIASALSEDTPVAEVENVSPCFRGPRPTARPVMAAAVVSTEPAARPPKRVRRQAAPAATRASEPPARPHTQPRPQAYPLYAMGPAGYPPLPGANATGPDGHWQAMQWQAQVAFSQHYAPPHMPPPPVAWGPPPAYPHQVPYYQPPPLQQHHQQPTQLIQRPHTHLQVPRPVRAQEFFHAPQVAHYGQPTRAPYVPECPMSPTPKARTKKSHRGPVTTTTITYGPPTHISTHNLTQSGFPTTTQVPRSAEDAAVLLPVHKNHLPFSEPMRTPERSPPVPVPLTGRGRTAEVMFMEGAEEEDADEILRESLRHQLMSPSPVDPDLLNSMFDDAI